ncbi:GIY-YIG nuclease family protein [Sporosarcina sp. 179-K 8C2 HS]|uniref:GIY-YIG nuclease family protein n=1 Tax=Sporosarcina sp. 179-K 8C2 HS TaxID=3142387 RepID=UPI0039A1D0B6
MARWIVIDCYSDKDLRNPMPHKYLLEKGLNKEEIDALTYFNENNWWTKYIIEKQEGIMIYVMNDDYISPKNYFYQKNLILACDSNRLNSFVNYTTDRYLVWKDFRTEIKYILERFIKEFMFSFRSTHQDNNWKVVDVTTEEVCDECGIIVKKGSLRREHNRGRWATSLVCEECILQKAKKSETNGGYIYFIREAQTGLVKIGRSTDVERRVQSLQISTPFDLEVVFKFYSDDYYLLETNCHNFFKSKKVRGEWYRLSEKDIECIKLYYLLLEKLKNKNV